MRLLIVLLALAAATGCGGIKNFRLFPTAQVVITNNCKGAAVRVTSVRGIDLSVPYGGQRFVTLERTPGRGTYILLTARGWNAKGDYLGLAERHFNTEQYDTREHSWRIDSLSGGLGCEWAGR